MSELNELREIIDAFVSYRNVLAPLQESLRSVVESYGSIKDDIAKLDKTFSGDTKVRLDKIYASLSAQAKSGQELSDKIERFSQSGEKYVKALEEMTAKFTLMEQKLSSLDALEKTAEGQIARLDAIINEKKVSYNVKDLQKSLDVYNKNVERVSDFINKDVAGVLQENGEKIDRIKRENEALGAALTEQSRSVADLVASFKETSDLLKKSVDRESVNEEYLFSVLDKWANSRNVKIKKK